MKKSYSFIFLIIVIILEAGCEKTKAAGSLSDFDSDISEQENSNDEDVIADENDENDQMSDESDNDDSDTTTEETYRITINLKDNIGSEAVVSKNEDEIEVTEAKAGETVTILAEPDSLRFVLLSVKSPEFTELSDKVLVSVDSESSFVMPAEDVEIEAVFKDVSNFERVYVKTKAEGKADGSSWNNALDSVQTAIEIANANGIPEVWIAAGTYYPDSYPLTTGNKHFSLKKNIAVRGGFVGIESDISQRTLKDHHTVFSGNGLSPIINNSWGDRIDSSTVIDGITFLDGQADNNGAAINNGSPTIINCIFINNRAEADSSGYVISSYESDMTIINSVFVNNDLGVIRKFHDNLRIVNSTFFSNKGVSILSANEITFEIYNSILFNEGDAEFSSLYSRCYIGGVIENSLVKNGFQDQLIVDSDPIFKDISGEDPLIWDLNLSSISPGLDNGSNKFLTEEFLNVDLDGNGVIEDISENLKDVGGNSRFSGKNVDVGAFESAELSTKPVYSVTVTKIDDVSGEDVYINKDQPSPDDYIEIMTDTTADRKVALKVMSDGKEIKLKHTVVSKDSKVVFIMPENDVEIIAEFGDFDRVYVKENGSGSGISWDDATGDVQKAIETASAAGIPEVWIAKGTYYPTSWPSGLTLDEHRHFSLRNNVSVIGGFAGNEMSADERVDGENETKLSGYDSGSETNSVLFQSESSATDETAVLDSVTVTHGFLRSFEGGAAIMLDSSSATIKNTIFRDNYCLASGNPITVYLGTLELENCSIEHTSDSWESRTTMIKNYHGILKIRNSVIEGIRYANVIDNQGTTYIENCVFRDNEFLDGGSVIYNSGRLNISRSMFINNSTKGTGTAIYTDRSPISITNSIFVNNSASERGGAIFMISNYTDDYKSRIINCTFYNNTAGEQGAIAGSMEALTIANSIFSGDENQIDPDKWESELEWDYLYPWIENSLVENEPFVYNWSNVIDADPEFMDVSGTDPYSWDLRLKSSSPCIDTGTVDAYDESMQKYDLNLDGDTEDDIEDFLDYLSNERWQGTGVDMGAYEYTP